MTEKKIIIIIYSILAAYCSYFILGNSFFLFTDNSWINSIDMVQDLVSWNFFNDDIWRFPIGMNPNYGLDIGNSIHVREIKLPEGVDLVLHGQDDPVIATAVKPKVVDIVEEEVSAETTEETPADDTEKAEEK